MPRHEGDLLGHHAEAGSPRPATELGRTGGGRGGGLLWPDRRVAFHDVLEGPSQIEVERLARPVVKDVERGRFARIQKLFRGRRDLAERAGGDAACPRKGGAQGVVVGVHSVVPG